MSKARKPDRKELARFKAMFEMGLTPNAIGKKTHRDAKTVRAFLKSPAYQEDAELNEMVDLIKSRELNDLYLLGAKGRHRLHELLDQGQTKVIETIALVDRTFQQRRLLEGGSTANIGVLTKIMMDSDEKLFVSQSKPGIGKPM
jgi:hypothetical protein